MRQVAWTDASGTAAANGTYTFKGPVQTAHWFVGKLIGKLPGAARTGAVWEIDSSGRPLDFGLSSPVSVGPLILQPGEVVTLTVTGLVSGDVVSAQFVGLATDDPIEAAAAYAPTANPLNSQVLPLVFAALQLVGVQDPAGTQIAGSGTGAANVNPAGSATGLDTYSPGLIFSRRTSAPADWEVATSGVGINTAPLAAGSSTIIAAPGLNHRLIILDAFLSYASITATNAGGALQDASAAVILTRWTQRSGAQVPTHVHGPIKLPANEALVLTNDDVANALFVVGGVLYTVSAAG